MATLQCSNHHCHHCCCDSNDDEYLANDVCFVDEFGGSGNGEGEFDLPSGLALHTDNDLLYVTDTDNNQIQIIDVDGNCSGNVELADNISLETSMANPDGDLNSPSSSPTSPNSSTKQMLSASSTFPEQFPSNSDN